MAGSSYVDIHKLDRIIKKTIETINEGKQQIYDIAEGARKECRRLEEELAQLKEQVKLLTECVERLERALKESKKKLAQVSKNFSSYTEEDVRQAYEKADNLRVELAVKREQESYLIRRRNELEMRLREALNTVAKADNLITNVGMALGYLTGDLLQVSEQLEDIQQKQLVGFRIIKAQEEERHRLAREIHDGPAQSLSNVVLKAEICERLIDTDVQKTRDELRKLRDTVRESLHDVRKIIYNLRPMSLDDLGLVPTLQRYIATFKEDTGIAVRYTAKGNFDEIRPEIALTVFRIIQETTSNIKKHAAAQNVTIKLEIYGNEVEITVSDDGIGFDLEEVKARGGDVSGGFGLFSMRERVELLSGSFEIVSEKGRGTDITVRIPLEPAKEV